MAIMLKSRTLVAYRVYALFLNVLAKRRKYFVGNEHTLVVLLTVCCIDERPEVEGSGVDEKMFV